MYTYKHRSLHTYLFVDSFAHFFVYLCLSTCFLWHCDEPKTRCTYCNVFQSWPKSGNSLRWNKHHVMQFIQHVKTVKKRLSVLWGDFPLTWLVFFLYVSVQNSRLMFYFIRSTEAAKIGYHHENLTLGSLREDVVSGNCRVGNCFVSVFPCCLVLQVEPYQWLAFATFTLLRLVLPKSAYYFMIL